MNKYYLALFTLLLSILLFSCQQDEWDKHSDRSGDLPDQNLYELIKQDGDLSKFSQMIDIAECSTLLSSSQTLTVWAPSNAALENIDINDVEKVTQLVKNHIARFNISTATPLGKNVRTVNQKVYKFSNDGGLNFGGSPLIEKDKLAKNGILHKVDYEIQYFHNVYEYLGADANTSKIGDFVNSFSEKRFDEELSILIGQDDTGKPIYDSIVTFFNPLFNSSLRYRNSNLGSINVEDSTYTMIIPTNRAWDAAYARISPYFKIYNTNKEYADSVQDVQTSLAILSDLIYRGKLDSPTSKDSLVSTSGSVIYDVANLFQGTTVSNASNGLAYFTDELRYNNTETWNKKIVAESEYQFNRTLGPNTTLVTRTVSSDDRVTGISRGGYVEILASRPTSSPSISYDIPSVLSGKYDIYVVFVPTNNKEPISVASKDSTRVSFEISYMNVDGKNKAVVVKSSNLITSGDKILKMKVFSELEFPISNFYDRVWHLYNASQDAKITTRLTIMANVTTQEFNNNILSRKFFIDKIVFEPVHN